MAHLNRKHFLTLALVTLGAAAACGDDDEPPAGTGGGGAGGSGGKKSGGTDTGANAGKSGSGIGAASGDAGAQSADAGAGQGGAGTGGTGEGLAGDAGATNGGAGETGAGGEGGGPVGAGGEGGGSGGDGGAGGSPEPGACAEGFLTLTGGETSHDHIPTSAAAFRAALAAHINSGNASLAFTLTEEFSHNHTITLTSNQVASLLAGSTVSGITSSLTSAHDHVYSLNCFQTP
jgi:hypothetical protein